MILVVSGTLNQMKAFIYRGSNLAATQLFKCTALELCEGRWWGCSGRDKIAQTLFIRRSDKGCAFIVKLKSCGLEGGYHA